MIIEWSVATEYEAKERPYIPNSLDIITRWPDRYGRQEHSRFINKLRSGALPIQIRARNAMRYVGSLGIYASPSYSLRILSRSFDLEEENFST